MSDVREGIAGIERGASASVQGAEEGGMMLRWSVVLKSLAGIIRRVWASPKVGGAMTAAERSRVWRLENPEKYRAYMKSYMARRRGD